ncbi:SGNH/GDSL hydrolase family protein [Sphingomonas sp. NFX23]|uniref:SGNH/GDSL hydrolase family protein n=1 Tax=Sphingomonas sp. NFX23 TaxID=2819532 RepID=UPI003CE928E3
MKSQPMTARHDLTVWRNDDYYEYLIRVIGLDLTNTALAMEVRRGGDVAGAPLIPLAKVKEGVNGATYETQGIHVRSVKVINGVQETLVAFRIDRGTLQALPYLGERGSASDFEYAFVIGGQTRLRGLFTLPAHAYRSDAAPANRQPVYDSRYVRQERAPDPGLTLTISLQSGVTLVIDGAGLVSASAGQADAAAERAAEALSQLEAITTKIPRAVDSYAEREAIPLAMRGNGLRVYVKGERDFEWSDLLFGPGSWTGRLTEEELTRRALQHGTQGQDTIDGLPATLAAQAGAIADLQARLSFSTLRVESFTVTPSQAELGSSVASLAMAWSYTGTPSGQLIERSDGQRVTGIAPFERAAVAEKLPVPAGVLIIGDSQAWEWAPEYAAALGLPLALSARPAQTIFKQAIIVGADPLTVTLVNGMLPAAGTKATVTLVNGGVTTAANPAAILHSALTGVDTIQIDLAVAGGTRRCTLSHDITNALDTYKIEQAAGGAAVAVADGALAVPTFKAMAATTHRVVIMAGHNDMRRDDPAGSFIGIRARTDSIMALCADNLNPVQLNDFWPAANAEEIALIPYIQAHSQWLRDKFPGAIAIDNAGRTLWERLRQSDKTIPASLRKSGDSLHLNADGRTAWTAHQQEDNAAHRAAVAPASTTATFTLRARAAIPGLPVVESTATATVRFSNKGHAGFIDKASGITSADANGMALSWWAESVARTLTTTAAAAGYLWYSQPSSQADPSAFKVNGFAVTPAKTLRNHTTATGQVVQYADFLLSNRLSAGAVMSMEIFA